MSLLATAKIDALHLVVIGFAATAFMGADSCRIEAVHETPWFEPIRFAASWTQLWFSIAVLYNNYIGAQPYYHRDGTRIGAWNLVDHAQATQRTARYWRGVDNDAAGLKIPLSTMGGIYFAPACLQAISRAKALAQQHGFRLIVMILPFNRDVIDRIDWPRYVDAK